MSFLAHPGLHHTPTPNLPLQPPSKVSAYPIAKYTTSLSHKSTGPPRMPPRMTYMLFLPKETPTANNISALPVLDWAPQIGL